MLKLIAIILTITTLSTCDGDGDNVWSNEKLSKYPIVSLRMFNPPKLPNESLSARKFELLQEYRNYTIRKATAKYVSRLERAKFLSESRQRLSKFIKVHIDDIKKLLLAADNALVAMSVIKQHKRMATSERKIRHSNAHIPFGMYVSPEYKCGSNSYYIISSNSQEDAQKVLTSEYKPYCFDYLGIFRVLQYYVKKQDAFYMGPFGESYLMNDPHRGLYCQWNENLGTNQCVYKVNPLEVFPESVTYEPKVHYRCGAYKYFIPPTSHVRCVFYISAMNFVFIFQYQNVQYKTNGMNFMVGNGQVFYTDEPWSLLSCTNFVCKWKHNQNQYIPRSGVQNTYKRNMTQSYGNWISM